MSDRKTRLKFYGLGDYGTFFQVEQAFNLLGDFDPMRTDYDINGVIELHNAAQYAEHGVFPRAATDPELDDRRSKLPDITRIVGGFFNGITDSTIVDSVSSLDFHYHEDVLDLLSRKKVFNRCTGTIVLEALNGARIHLGELLSCQALVRAYDDEVRSLIISNPRHAEQLIGKYLMSDRRRETYLPASLTSADSRALLESFLDSEDPNLNYVDLIATARVDRASGIDPKLKLKAKRKHDALAKTFFESNEGVKTGCEVRIVEDQTQAVVATLDGLMGIYSYSRRWLAENLDYPTILNNFIYLFEFSNTHMLLSLPSFYADLGVFDRFMVTSGRESYRTGAAFKHKDTASLLQAMMYTNFLQSQGVQIEEVLTWFFSDYLRDEFGAENLKFRPSSATSTYLEKCRHLFSEMESVLKQFGLFAENGELDPELLAVTSEALSYPAVPSMLEGKYIYVTDNQDIRRIQHLLFSDQSGLCYITENLQGHSFAELLIKEKPSSGKFLDHQRGDLQFLIQFGVLEERDGRVRFTSASQFRILEELHHYEAANYFRFSQTGRDAIDSMVAAGWLERRSSLLTAAEASYFNYYLNQSEFSNGPDLRNAYLHGSQMDGEDDQVHLQTYITALRMLIALVIKINDDFDLRDREQV